MPRSRASDLRTGVPLAARAPLSPSLRQSRVPLSLLRILACSVHFLLRFYHDSLLFFVIWLMFEDPTHVRKCGISMNQTARPHHRHRLSGLSVARVETWSTVPSNTNLLNIPSTGRVQALVWSIVSNRARSSERRSHVPDQKEQGRTAFSLLAEAATASFLSGKKTYQEQKPGITRSWPPESPWNR